ncbi:type I 3-dehydroquinate dehydratase [Thermovirga lienii]|uniref:type I 3-dehydroquinate dehydratase n=1 Tax=Thermovirga lienii TaxID=336261 RepID=UPI000EDD51F4|nr:type I 3-dehydroquinate dehydratase [Thermovirga lienii]
MRPTPLHPIKTRGKTLGAPKPLVCISLIDSQEPIICEETKRTIQLAPDIIELRVDAWDFIEDVETSLSVIKEVRKIAKDVPIILTCRGHWEGGFKEVSDEAKFSLYEKAVKLKLVDYIDIELAYGEEKIQKAKELLKGTSTYLIVSFHDFEKTPPEEELYSIMASEIKAGAHVAKLAVMPKKEEDVLALLAATLSTRRDFPEVPLITMSMGELGSLSRVIGGKFGSDLTFAVGNKESAPGQIPVTKLKQCLDALF